MSLEPSPSCSSVSTGGSTRKSRVGDGSTKRRKSVKAVGKQEFLSVHESRLALEGSI